MEADKALDHLPFSISLIARFANWKSLCLKYFDFVLVVFICFLTISGLFLGTIIPSILLLVIFFSSIFSLGTVFFLGFSLGFIMFFDIFYSFISFLSIGFFKGIIFKSAAYVKLNPIKINVIIFAKNVIFLTIKILLNESINYVISIYV